MRLKDYIDKSLILVGVRADSKSSLFELLAERVISRMPQIDRDALLARLHEREAQESTGIGHGVAVPHTVVDELDHTVCLLAQVPDGIEFDSVDRAPVRFVFLLLGPSTALGRHIKILARIARLVKSAEFLREMAAAPSSEAVLRLVLREDERHVS